MSEKTLQRLRRLFGYDRAIKIHRTYHRIRCIFGLHISNIKWTRKADYHTCVYCGKKWTVSK